GLPILLSLYFFPRTPVTIGIVDVATAGKEFHVASPPKLGASPSGENLGIIDVALVSAFRLWRGAEHENLAQVAARGIQAPTRSLRECCDLGRADFEHVAEIIFAFYGEDVSTVPGSGYQPAT